MKPFQTLITPVVIAAMTVTGLSTVPAKADSNDLAKVLIGIGAVAVIASALENKQKTQTYGVTSSTYGRVVTTPDWQRDRERDRNSWRLSHALPANCVKSYDAGHRTRELYSGACLDRVNYRLADLPRTCAVRVEERNHKRGTAYVPQCLARYGFYQVDMRDKPRGWESDHRNDRHITWGN